MHPYLGDISAQVRKKTKHHDAKHAWEPRPIIVECVSDTHEEGDETTAIEREMGARVYEAPISAPSVPKALDDKDQGWASNGGGGARECCEKVLVEGFGGAGEVHPQASIHLAFYMRIRSSMHACKSLSNSVTMQLAQALGEYQRVPLIGTDGRPVYAKPTGEWLYFLPEPFPVLHHAIC